MSVKTFAFSKLVKKTRLKTKQDRQSILLLASFVVIIIIGAIVYFRFIKKGNEQKLNEQIIKSLDQKVQESVSRSQDGARKLNIHEDDVKDAITEVSCVFSPENGKCPDGLELTQAGCCVQTETSSESGKQQSEEQLKQMLLMTGTTIVAEVFLTDILPKLINRSGVISKLSDADQLFKKRIDDLIKQLDNASRGLLKGGKPVSRQGSQLLARATAKIAATIAKRMIVRTMATMIRIMSKLGSGPAGWVLLIFETISLTLDLASASSYDTLIDNTEIIRGRNQAVYKLFEKAKEGGFTDLPLLFPFDMLFPKEADLAMLEVSISDMRDAMFNLMTDERFSKDKELVVSYLEIMKLASNVESNPDLEEEFEKKAIEFNKHPLIEEILGAPRKGENSKIQDKKIFDNLVKRLKNRDKRLKTSENPNDYDETDIMLVPEFSNENVIGISLTEKGAKKWNANRKSDWLKHYNPFDVNKLPEADKEKPVTEDDVFVASYSDTYLTVDASNPGADPENPNIITKKAPRKATFLYPFGPLVALCEAERTSGSTTKEAINPPDYGVSFDTTTGVCNYTRAYCKRYNIDFKTNQYYGKTSYNNCKLSKGQEWAEFIVGSEVTRNAREKWEFRKKAFGSGNAEDITTAIALILVDPLGLNQMYGEQVINNFDKNKDKYGTAAAVGIAIADSTGMGQVLYENFASQMAGRDKFCEKEADECKKITAKHRGGNFMNWSARNSKGEIYSRGQGYQNQVKHGEDHEFFIPKDGYFKVSCVPFGQKINYPYSEIDENKEFEVSCWFGKQDRSSRKPETVFFDTLGGKATKAANDALEESIKGINKGIDGVEDGIKKVEQVFEGAGDQLKEIVDEVKEVGDDIVEIGKEVEKWAENEGKKWENHYDSVVDVFNRFNVDVKEGWDDTRDALGEVGDFFTEDIPSGKCIIM